MTYTFRYVPLGNSLITWINSKAELVKHTLALIAVLNLLIFCPSYSTARGLEHIKVKLDTGETIALYKESHALVIGVSDYTAGWPRLRGVKDDVLEVSEALKKSGFSVKVVENPGRLQLDKSIRDFITDHGTEQENRLLIYYAGHGFTSTFKDGRKMGYLVPANAPDPNRDEKGFLREAMSMQNIETYARNIQSKHALFVFDSCFAGSIFNITRALPPPSIQRKAFRPVRQFITSGSADQQVPDKSVFRVLFTRALEGEGDLNSDGYITGSELGSYLEDGVTNYRKGQQTPQYGKLNDPELDQGDFIFVIPNLLLEEPSKTAGLELDDLLKKAEKQEELRRERERVEKLWVSWQARMDADFKKIQAFDKRDISSGLKIAAWNKFLVAYNEDNPTSERDEALRKNATKKINFLKTAILSPKKKEKTAEFFTFGSSYQEVKKVMGPPDKINNTRISRYYKDMMRHIAFHLFYGKSSLRIVKKTDKVVAYINKGDLKILIEPKTFSTVSGFTLGSSFDEVISVMGTPDVIDTEYSFYVYYGKSKITFDRNDRVESWINKGNLKLR